MSGTGISRMRRIWSAGGTARGDHRGHPGAVPDQAEEPVCHRPGRAEHCETVLCSPALDKDGKNNLANRYVGELVEQLIQEGQLVQRKPGWARHPHGSRNGTPATGRTPAGTATDDPVRKETANGDLHHGRYPRRLPAVLGANTSPSRKTWAVRTM